MRFQKYPSITNHYQIEFIEKIKLEGQDGGNWVVTEKIHGANFSIWINATRTYIAKRTALLKGANESNTFYNVGLIRATLEEKARMMYRVLNPTPKNLAIYGELFGGSYPHPKVAAISSAKKVQKGVWYSPNLEFAVFDIKDDDGFLNFDEMIHLCNTVGFYTVPVIGHGTFEDCLNFRNDYISKVGKELGYPHIKGNRMEGIVIKPLHNAYLRRGERVIIKSKNPKLSETSRSAKIRKEIKLPEVGREFIEKAMPKITAPRYQAVISKIGNVTPKDFGRILGLIIQDIYDELMKEEVKLYLDYQNMDKAERRLIHKIIAPQVIAIIRQELLGVKMR